MAATDPNFEWLGHVQPIGLVVSPVVLARYGLVPEEQTRVDSEAMRTLLSEEGEGPALLDPWVFFRQVLGWNAQQVAGAPNGPPLPPELPVKVEESDTDLVPTWAVAKPGGGWQLLVRIEAPGVQPEERGALEGWEATPHQRLERLVRETGVATGILVTDNELRLIHAPRGETSGWLKFPLRSLKEVGGRQMLGGLKLILSSYRLHNDAPERLLSALLKESRDAQAEVSSKLAAQVLGALHELLRGLHAADRSRIEALAVSLPGHLYEGLLTVLLRLVFLLYAEDRDLIPSRTDADARRLYESYGVRPLYLRLVDDVAHYPDTMDDRRGAWARLLALFRLVHKGGGSGWIRGRGGKLFDPAVFPFLQGQETSSDAPKPAPVSDGCIYRILDGLVNLDGEKLSYRTLDVEQIGSVYETVMGFTVETMSGPTAAIKAGKNNRTPVFVDLAALTAKKGAERAKHLKEEGSRASLPDKAGKAIAAAKTEAEVFEALRPIIDERGSPGGQIAAPGTPLLQPTDERRRTGSHYTPRNLTEPIVRHALEPAFERLGPDARPADVLDLKVCDPAMGSGAFLVEACRALAAWLIKAWARWPETRPSIPPDEDEELHARRLVAQRCLYGVDRNPLATDLAKLSLWLATLARDHEFTFLDHALKSGDSLVGLDTGQITATHWDTSKPPSFVGKLVHDHLKDAEAGRAKIRDHDDQATEAELRPMLRAVDTKLEVARLIGDGVISAFFKADRPKDRIERLVAFQKVVQSHLGTREWIEPVKPFVAALGNGEHAVRPFHWQIEFPEVFSRKNGGFDAIVGNPPFAGKNTIIAGNRRSYLPWLQTLHEGAHGNADLVAHFFRRAFGLLRKDGVFGLIATNTIGQGDTRTTGLTTILGEGGAILRARRRLKWPGEAAVVVSVVHVAKGPVDEPVLDGRSVRRISAYLVEGDFDTSPASLAANEQKAFAGSFLLGMGFTFDDTAAAEGEAESLDTMRALISKNPRNAERIFPYIGGEEVNSSPTHAHHRYVIDFADFPLMRHERLKRWARATQDEREAWLRTAVVPEDYPNSVATDWPDLLSIVERLVKPKRDKDKRDSRRQKWWRFAERAPGLYAAIAPLDGMYVASRIGSHIGFVPFPKGYVIDIALNAFAFDDFAAFAVLQSRVHELWARFFSSTLEDRLRYTPSDCFRTFPFSLGFETHQTLEAAGEAYHAFRAQLMIDRNEGLTKTYNRFHDRSETASDIVRLRELHADMDRAVLRAYGWDDLADRAAPDFIEQDADEGKKAKTRLDWPAEFKDELLTRLLALNAARAAEERAAGLVAATGDEDEDEAEIEDA